MIREALLSDIDVLLDMGRKFFYATQYPRLMDYSEEATINTIKHLIEDESGFLLVNDDEGVNGMIGAMVYPFYMSGVMTGQELFWWSNRKGAGLGLLTAAEDKAKNLGAKSFAMISLDGLGHERLDKLYHQMGYSRSEHSYIKGF